MASHIALAHPASVNEMKEIGFPNAAGCTLVVRGSLVSVKVMPGETGDNSKGLRTSLVDFGRCYLDTLQPCFETPLEELFSSVLTAIISDTTSRSRHIN